MANTHSPSCGQWCQNAGMLKAVLELGERVALVLWCALRCLLIEVVAWLNPIT